MSDAYRSPVQSNEKLTAGLLKGFHLKPSVEPDYSARTEPFAPQMLHMLANPVSIQPDTDMQPRLIIDVKKSPVFANLHSFHQMGAITAATMLSMAEGLEYIDLSAAKKTVDFGAGSGGPTLALAELAKINGGAAYAIESHPQDAQDISDLGILPADQVQAGDGIKLLHNAPRNYDLITAFMLGPDDEQGALTRALLAAGREALNPGGHILITSDIDTMSVVRQVCRQEAVAYDYIQGVPLSNGDFLPSAVIASLPAK